MMKKKKRQGDEINIHCKKWINITSDLSQKNSGTVNFRIEVECFGTIYDQFSSQMVLDFFFFFFLNDCIIVLFVICIVVPFNLNLFHLLSFARQNVYVVWFEVFTVFFVLMMTVSRS